jgi:hypothetical protein
MPKSKSTKQSNSKKKSNRKSARKAPVTRAAKSKVSKKTSVKTARSAKKKLSSKKPVREISSPESSSLSGRTFSREPRRTNWRTAGQSGDVQGLSGKAIVDSESVEELLEEGQAREAAAISGVENAPDADQGEVRTRQVLEDDVPEEYLDED